MTEVNGPTRDPDVAFEASLPFVLTSTMSILAMAPFYEGFDAWVDVAYAALSDELRRDVHLIFYPFGAPLIYERLRAERPTLESFPAFVGWLATLGEEAIQDAVSFALKSLALGSDRSTAATTACPDVNDPEALASFLEGAGCRWWEFEHTDRGSFAELVALLQTPSALRSRIILDVTRFWEEHFRDEYARCRQSVARRVGRDRASKNTGSFAEVLAQVTGRPVPEQIARRHGGVTRLTFVPSSHAGPYVNYVPIGPGGEELVVTFNAWLTDRTVGDEAHSIRRMFAPLKALSDETRLEILEMLGENELFAQQIVDRLTISQPSVSRHLRLMVAAEILSERRDEKMKYYRINEETLAGLARAFSAFAGTAPIASPADAATEAAES